MKFTKVVILAGALAVSTVPQIAHSQDAATPVTSAKAEVAEWSKKVGMDCTVFVSGSKVVHPGKLETVTDSWIEVSNDVRHTSEVGPFVLTYTTRIPAKNVTRIEFGDKTKELTKISPSARLVIPASALRRLQSSTADDSQLAAFQTAAEEAKAAKMQQVVGKNCQVLLQGEKSEDFHEGTVKSVTAAWIILESQGEEEENGVTVKVKNRIHLPMKELREIKALPDSTP